MTLVPPECESNLVDPADACPICGERNADRLVWVDDEHVQCTMCGCEFRPGSEVARA